MIIFFSKIHHWQPKMELRASLVPILLCIAALMAASCPPSQAEGQSKSPFEDSFDIMWSEDHFKTSEDGQIWYLSLDKETGMQCMLFPLDFSHSFPFICKVFQLLPSGCGFQTKQRYRFGWFSMKLKLVGGDSAGVVTAYYVSPLTSLFEAFSEIYE